MLKFFFNLDFAAIPTTTVEGTLLVPLILLSVLVLMVLGIKKKWGFVKIVFTVFFAVYIFTLIEIFFFPIPISQSEIIAAREFSIPRMNLIPFRDILTAQLPIVIRNLVGNIVLFIPLGFSLPIIIKREHIIRIASIAVVLSACLVELIQYVGSFLIFRIDWKIVDVDDLIMNIIGGLIGIACYSIMNKIVVSNTAGKESPSQED